MKKKLLSVLMAGALVATSSVNAFAAENNITGSDAAEHTTNISVTGDVQNDNGEVKPGTLNVTVPTTAAFTVNRDKALIGATITIQNSGSQDVDVFAKGFADITGAEHINVQGASAISGQARNNVALNLQGNLGTAYLGTAAGNNKTGIYSDAELSANVNEVKLSTIRSNNSGNLTLAGTAGDSSDGFTEAVQDTFTLVLKIKKSDSK